MGKDEIIDLRWIEMELATQRELLRVYRDDLSTAADDRLLELQGVVATLNDNIRALKEHKGMFLYYEDAIYTFRKAFLQFILKPTDERLVGLDDSETTFEIVTDSKFLVERIVKAVHSLRCQYSVPFLSGSGEWSFIIYIPPDVLKEIQALEAPKKRRARRKQPA